MSDINWAGGPPRSRVGGSGTGVGATGTRAVAPPPAGGSPPKGTGSPPNSAGRIQRPKAPTGHGGRQGGRQTSLAIKLVLALVFLGTAFMAFRASDMTGGDFASWYEASKEWQSGKDVYAEPIVEGEIQHGLAFLLLLVPFTWLDINEAQQAWLALSVLLLLHGVFMLGKMLTFDAHTLGRSGTRYAPWLALLLVLPFLHDFIRYRQTDIFVLWITLFGIFRLGRRSDLAAGGCLGLAAAISLPSLALLPWLIYKQRILAAFMFVVGFALTAGLPMAAPNQGLTKTLDHYEAYVGLVMEDISSETMDPAHQSLHPLVRSSSAPGGILPSPERFAASQWIIRALGGLLVVFCVFWIRPGFGRRGMHAPGSLILIGEAGLVMALAVLLWPLAPLHYYSWLYPAAVFLVCAAMSRPKGNLLYAWPALVAFVAMITLPHATSMSAWPDHHGFAAGLLLLVLLLGWTLRGECRLRAGKSGGRRGRP